MFSFFNLEYFTGINITDILMSAIHISLLESLAAVAASSGLLPWIF